MIKKKIAYVPLAVDILHKGHLNIIKIAKKYGVVVIGLLTDKAIAQYKDLTILNYNERESLVKELAYVDKVIAQDSHDYEKILNQIKPDYFIHGDDWKFDNRRYTRKKVIKILKKWKGRLIEPKYTKNISSSLIKNKILELSSPSNRVSTLKRSIVNKDITRIIESHNALTGLIIENTFINKNNKKIEFDGMWSSSLTDSATKGLPDNSSLSFSSRISSLQNMLDVTTKPVVFDADNGGQIEHLAFLVRSLERSGVSAIIMEDKIGLKKNSLFNNQSGVRQDKPTEFAKKIKKICRTRKSEDFMVIARIESFILGKGLNDALRRAEIYSKAGADAIFIHSKEKTPKEIFAFAKAFKKSKFFKPLVAVPSTYSIVYEKELIKNGFKLVIYANQLLRAAYPAMLNIAKMILHNNRSFEAEKKIIPIKELINLIKSN